MVYLFGSFPKLYHASGHHIRYKPSRGSSGSGRTKRQSTSRSKSENRTTASTSAPVCSYHNMTTPSLNVSDPASVTSGQPLACTLTSTFEPPADMCLRQIKVVTNNASTSIVTVTKTTRCDRFTESDCNFCHPPLIYAPDFLRSVAALDPATTRAFAPADGKDGSVSQTPDTASPASANLFSFLTQPTIQQTTTRPQVTEPTHNQTPQAPNQNPPAQISDFPAQSSPTQDSPAQGQGQSTQIKPGLNQNLPAQLPSTQVDPEIRYLSGMGSGCGRSVSDYRARCARCVDLRSYCEVLRGLYLCWQQCSANIWCTPATTAAAEWSLTQQSLVA